MNTPTMETIYRGSGAVENLSGSDCPAIKSFKTVSEYRLAAGKSKIQALVFASVCAGASFATAVAGFATYMLGADPDYQLASIAAIAVGGLGAIFTAANADGQLKDAMRRIEGDTRIAYELKVHARALEDKVSDLRAALNDAQGAGEAAGERGTSPAATVHQFNGKRT